jgi:hypothetical protein
MDPEELRDILSRDKFRPFIITMTNGRNYQVTHPEVVHMGVDTIYFTRPLRGDATEFDDPVYLACVNISSIEPLDLPQRPEIN